MRSISGPWSMVGARLRAVWLCVTLGCASTEEASQPSRAVADTAATLFDSYHVWLGSGGLAGHHPLFHRRDRVGGLSLAGAEAGDSLRKRRPLPPARSKAL